MEAEEKKVEEKKEEIKQEIKHEHPKKEKGEKTFKAILIVLIIIAVGFLIFVFVKDYVNLKPSEFDYHGLQYTKIREGGIDMYKTSALLFKNGEQFIYNLVIRHDPKELDKIPVDINGSIYKKLYISYDPVTVRCKDVPLSSWRLGDFFGALGVNASGALHNLPEDATEAEKESVKTCADSLDATVVLIREGNESKIYRDAMYKDCIIVDVKDCEVLQSSERLVLAMIDNFFITI